MEITVRQYEERDRDTVIACWNDEQNYLVDVDLFHTRQRVEKDAPEYTDLQLAELKHRKGAILVAEDGGKIVGIVLGYVAPHDAEDKLHQIPASPAMVQDLYVVPEYRSKGIGAMLMNEIEKFFKAEGCDQLTLEALVSNERSLTFYEKLGYGKRYVTFFKKI